MAYKKVCYVTLRSEFKNKDTECIYSIPLFLNLTAVRLNHLVIHTLIKFFDKNIIKKEIKNKK